MVTRFYRMRIAVVATDQDLIFCTLARIFRTGPLPITLVDLDKVWISPAVWQKGTRSSVMHSKSQPISSTSQISTSYQ